MSETITPIDANRLAELIREPAPAADHVYITPKRIEEILATEAEGEVQEAAEIMKDWPDHIETRFDRMERSNRGLACVLIVTASSSVSGRTTSESVRWRVTPYRDLQARGIAIACEARRACTIRSLQSGGIRSAKRAVEMIDDAIVALAAMDYDHRYEVKAAARAISILKTNLGALNRYA